MTDEKKVVGLSNRQRHAYQLTINNPLQWGYDHNKIKEILTVGFSTLKFFCMADEIGKNGTPHTHIYVYFNSRVRFSKLKKHFPEAHIEAALGSVQANIDYIKKNNRWENSEKSETKVEGSFEDWGTIPVQRGLRPEMEELYQMIKCGYTNAEILEINNDYISLLDKIDKVRITLLQEKYKNIRRLNLEVVYVYGATGTGKTRGILDKHGDCNVYRVTQYKHAFDMYNCQNILVLEEYRSNIQLGELLSYLDVYAVELPARYVNRFACYEKVYIVSNWKLEEQYLDVQRESPETWKAFLRRIHKVVHYQENGEIKEYSMDEYKKKMMYFENDNGSANPFTNGKDCDTDDRNN